MDELKEKLSYLSVATPQVLAGLQSEEGQAVQELVGPELMKQLAEQMRLEELYVVANAAADRDFGHGEEGDEAREEETLLKKNTLDLCRKMRQVPDIVTQLRNFQERDANRNVLQFLRTLAEMQELTLRRLTTTVEEQQSRAELVAHYTNREQEANKRKLHLEKELTLLKSACERAQSMRTEILTKLKADLLDVRDSKQEKMASLRSRYEGRMKDHEAAFAAKEEDLRRKINALREANAKAKANNEEEETAQKGKAKRLVQDVKQVITQYDEKVKQMAFDIGEKRDAYKKEQKQYTELADHFKKVDEEKATIAAEEAIAEARKKKREAERERRDASAALVQAFWRGIICRETFGAMKKAKKKKGGGKKKK
mmetsp:Transcript_88848/g.248693  ORF Transcript_88848/g.248693 Transcript_88848/m.248693 type:complete len:370 (-) Transcript_88848:71-1180(-)|eukprot:CAMPEP_0176245118 /NCGR_PEP_ID=MMETSP0121_2-20121125/31779_1 /TAXON_ID=160619 /ORGANISM="Kryptoperidinium foliaceum, Strain CCMP 1326" /LENGTH=369 /DNA_ID=CAMNT_0017584741 /DNA_START=1 /DNA_END=1110 /DNA_ORIENTATION=+